MNEDNLRAESNKDEREKVIQEIKKFEPSPWVFLVRRNKLTALIIIALFIFGLATIKNIPRELNPDVQIPIAVVVTAFPGASPLDVEKQVTDEIESQIAELAGIKKINSTSSLGFSAVTVEFEAGEDLDKSIREVKDKVDNAKTSLPEDATDPEVFEVDVNSDPVLTFALASEQYDISELKDFAENIKDEIKGIPLVSDVAVVGGREKVVKIDFSQEKLARFGLSAQGVIVALNSNNVDFPLGVIEIGDFRYNIRAEGKFKNAFEIANQPIGATAAGQFIYLEDVAEVRDGFKEEFSRSRLSVAGSMPSDAVSISVFKKSGGDVTKLAQEVKDKVKRMQGEAYPENVAATVVLDFSEFVTDSLDTLLRNGTATVVLIVILLLVFLGFREALLVGPAIPFSFFIAFIIMSLIGESLNTISLFSLVLALGLLVDSAIVMVEGMYEKASRFGFKGYEAAIATMYEYAAPLLSGMLTTMAAFFPLLFVKGVFGAFIFTIPVVVMTTLAAGFFVAVTIIPALGTYFIKTINVCPGNIECQGLFRKVREYYKKLKYRDAEDRWANRIFRKIIERYRQFLPTILISQKKRRLLIFGAWVLFFVSLSLPASGLLKFQAFVEEDADFFFMNLEMPNGTTLNRTDEVVQKIESVLKEEKEITNFVTNIGSSFGLNSGTNNSEGTSNLTYFQVNLTKTDERETTSSEIVSAMRRKIKPIVTEGKVTFQEINSGPPTGSPIELRVIGSSLMQLDELASQIARELANIPTTIDIDTSIDLSAGDFVFFPNKEIIARRGLSVIQIALELRNGISRNDNIEITKDGEEIKLDLGYDKVQLASAEDIKDIIVTNSNGDGFSLSELGELQLSAALSNVKHLDTERVVIITADTDGGNASEIVSELQKRIDKSISLPAGYSVKFGGETQELNEVYIDMLLKMILGIVLILFILMLQFDSYKQVLIILFTIPLAMIGVIWGMTIFKMILDIPAFIGIVSLTGIVVNNAIILIDRINKELADGKALIFAAQSAGAVRFRPIFLTTITTVVGLLPLSLTEPMWRNLGFAIIFGLTFSTLLTLFIVPAMYVSLYKNKYGDEYLRS